jgi:hypothetical protein
LSGASKHREQEQNKDMKKSITPDDLVFILSPLLEERINDAARREDDKAFAALQQARLQMERLLSPLRLSGVTALIDRASRDLPHLTHRTPLRGAPQPSSTLAG